MKRLLIVLYILLTTSPVYAAEVFRDKGLKEIQVVEIKDGSAYIQTMDGKKAEIFIGDIIGKEEGVVVEIDKAFITIKIGNTRTRLPVVYGFER